MYKSTKSLGEIIKEERLKKRLTQTQLGKLIGLKAARVSKIEHGAPITPEVASFILRKMGSDLVISLTASKKFEKRQSDFLLSAITHFAKKKNRDLSSAYAYLDNFRGLQFLNRFYSIEQTLSDDEITDNLTRICNNNGGAIR